MESTNEKVEKLTKSDDLTADKKDLKEAKAAESSAEKALKEDI